MRTLVTGLAALLLLAVVAQFWLAAVGALDSAPTEEAFGPHRALGNAILGLAVATTLAAAVARMPGRLVGTVGLVAGLVLVQSVIREVARALGDGSSAGLLVFGLHAVNGLAILGVTGMVVRWSRTLSASTGRPAS